MLTQKNSSFSDLYNTFNGSPAIICGCGESLSELPQSCNCLTLGVNDCATVFCPDYLVVLNPLNSFPPERASVIRSTSCKGIFSQFLLQDTYSPVIKIRLSRFSFSLPPKDYSVPYGLISPFTAICIAGFLGCNPIGFIGVDFTEYRLEVFTGNHHLFPLLDKIDKEFKLLRSTLLHYGISLYNLSSVSRLQSVPYLSLFKFLDRKGFNQLSYGV